MTQSKRATVIVDYQIQGVQQAIQGTTQILAATKALDAGINAQSGSLTRAVESNVLDYKALADAAQAAQFRSEGTADALVTPLQLADVATKTLIKDIGDLGRDIEALPEPDLSAFDVADSGGAAGGAGLGGLRQGASRATSLLSLSGIGGQAGSVAAGSLGLVEQFGVAGALALPLALGLKAVSDAEQEAAKGAKEYASELQSIASQVASGATTEDIQKNIADLGTLQKVQLQGRDALRNLQRQYEDTTAANDKGIIGFSTYADTITLLNQKTSELTGGQVKYVADIDTALDEAQTNVNKTTSSIAVYNTELGTQQVLLNDAADATKRLKDANKALTDELVSSQVKGVQDVIAAQQTTAEDRAAKIRQDLEEQAVIHQQLASGNLLQGAHDKLVIQYQSLQTEVELLTHTSNTYADQLLVEDAAKKSLADTEQQSLDNLKDQGDARTKIAETEAEIAQIRSEGAAKQLQAYQDYQDKDNQSESEAKEKLLQLTQDTADKRQQIEQDDADKRAQIERKANATISNAIYGRNALAAFLAVQQKQQDLADEKKAHDKSLAQLDKANQKQQDQINQAADKQYDAHYTAYQKELANLQSSLNKEVNAKQLALAQEQKGLNDLIVAAGLFAQAVAAAQARVSALAGTPAPASPVSTGATGGSSNPNGVGTPMPSNPSIGQTWTDFSGKLWLWNGHGWQPATAVRQYATGIASVPYTGLAMVHQGERIIPAAQNRMFSGGMGGGLQITIPVTGTQMTKRDIIGHVVDQVDKTLTEAGWD